MNSIYPVCYAAEDEARVADPRYTSGARNMYIRVLAGAPPNFFCLLSEEDTCAASGQEVALPERPESALVLHTKRRPPDRYRHDL
ncbi:hypothetical protein GWI33_019794 [Rhynchophorus ferrugineus]|uniref:Uncharacterized protein n=1 Tax=Rhynchophorus ferrugineus TaxID=354439 RepID=A0A834HQQ0_RHYFE|nr:hypothetical protein GWI33_019794 [Rhynchophorus ferrugineus]